MNLSDQLRRRADSLQWIGDGSPEFVMREAADRLDDLEEALVDASAERAVKGRHALEWIDGIPVPDPGEEHATLNDLRSLSQQMQEFVGKAVEQGQQEHKAFDKRLRKVEPFSVSARIRIAEISAEADRIAGRMSERDT